MPSTNFIPPDANSNITLSTIVEALADDFEIGKTSEYHPTSGRVLKDSEDGTIYLADGTSWNDVSSAIGIDTPRTQTGELTNVWDHICEDSSGLDDALNDAADAATDEVSIMLGRGAFTPSVSLPVDISDTAVTFVGHFPKMAKGDYNPDLRNLDTDGGTIIDCTGASGLFTGNFVRGSRFENYWVYNTSGDAHDFGATDKLGLFHSTIKNVYGLDVTDALFKLTNIQHVYGEHIKAHNTRRVLNIINDHTNHAGANSVFVDPYLDAAPAADGDKVDGGIRLKATDGFLNHTTLIRPQVNMHSSGTAGTGSNIKAESGANEVTTLTVVGGNLEGETDKALHGSGLVNSYVQMFKTQAVNYDVYLEAGTTTTTDVYVIITDGKATVRSPADTNFVFGKVGGLEGVISGLVYDNSAGHMKLLYDNVANRIDLTSDGIVSNNRSVRTNINAGISSAADDLSMKTPNDDGELRRHNGTDANSTAAGWYKADTGNTQWKNIEDGTTTLQYS